MFIKLENVPFVSNTSMMSPCIEQKYEIEHDTSKSDLKCLAALSTFFRSVKYFQVVSSYRCLVVHIHSMVECISFVPPLCCFKKKRREKAKLSDT